MNQHFQIEQWFAPLTSSLNLGRLFGVTRERRSALLQRGALEDDSSFPFRTATPKFDGLGLDLIVVHKGKQYAIAAHSVELLKPFPEGHLYLAAYLEWKSNQ